VAEVEQCSPLEARFLTSFEYQFVPVFLVSGRRHVVLPRFAFFFFQPRVRGDRSFPIVLVHRCIRRRLSPVSGPSLRGSFLEVFQAFLPPSFCEEIARHKPAKLLFSRLIVFSLRWVLARSCPPFRFSDFSFFLFPLLSFKSLLQMFLDPPQSERCFL